MPDIRPKHFDKHNPEPVPKSSARRTTLPQPTVQKLSEAEGSFEN